MIELVDTHCHLDFKAFDEDRQEVVQRAHANGVKEILVPGVDFDSSRAAIRLAEQYGGIFAAVGLHPNNQDHKENTLARWKQIARHPRVVAIGEIGLDYYRKAVPHEQQRQFFNEQLAMASELCLPVIIHNRQADDDMIEIISTWYDGLRKSGSVLAERPGVFHSFSSGIECARIVTGMNFYIGISGPVTFPNAHGLRQVVQNLAPERILIETDAPFLAPHPGRGKRNEPVQVQLIARKIAEIQNQPLEDLARITTSNAKTLFNW